MVALISGATSANCMRVWGQQLRGVDRQASEGQIAVLLWGGVSCKCEEKIRGHCGCGDLRKREWS